MPRNDSRTCGTRARSFYVLPPRSAGENPHCGFSPPLHVVLVDDEPIVRYGLERILQDCSDVVLAATAADIERAELVLRKKRSTIVLLDMVLGIGTGLEVMRKLDPDAGHRVICYSSYADPEMVASGVSLGAWGYLLKTAERNVLLDAVRAVGAGHRVFSGEALTIVEVIEQTEQLVSAGGPLTKREREVLMLIARGLSATEIGRRLGIARTSVQRMWGRVRAKLGLVPSVLLRR